MSTDAPETLTSYQFSGKSSAVGTAILIVITLLGSAVIGALYQRLTSIVDIPVLMPIFAGLLVAFVVKWGQTWGKCRSLPMIVAIAVLAGILTYGVRLVLDSQQVRPALVRGITRSMIRYDGLLPAAAHTEAERVLTPWQTVRLYLRLQANYGVTLTRSSSHSYSQSSPSGSQAISNPSDLTLSGVWYWLLLLAEAGAAGGTAGAIAARYGLVEPFCESCQRWMKGTKVVKAAPRQVGEMARCVQNQEWKTLLKMTPTGSVDSQNYASVTVYRCPKCAVGTASVFFQAGSIAKRLLHVELSPHLAEYLCHNSGKTPAVSGNNLAYFGD